MASMPRVVVVKPRAPGMPPARLSWTRKTPPPSTVTDGRTRYACLGRCRLRWQAVRSTSCPRCGAPVADKGAA